ncbi:MAG: hypothetical protein EA343_03370 [Nodularia sp. (in: Bacteria)]|nr:MAG: hypothetical protein EA343_03370 [Nodularia sp. (in: cyanobacteria)]
MPLVSTFELLVKRIAPIDNLGNLPPNIAQKLEKVARRVVQGYFLTIANTTNTTASLRLEFIATTPNLNLDDTVVVFDIFGDNKFADLRPRPNDPKRFIFDLRIPPHDTGLVTLLPDLTNLDLIQGKRDLEIRGYVNISRVNFRGPTYDLLVTPEQRGTFLPNDINQILPDFDQIAYGIPTANGGSFLRLEPASSLFFPVNPVNVDILDKNKELLDLMFERLDNLE